MHVRRVIGSGVRRETYTVIDDDGRVVELADDYLALCPDREHSPNTLRARAYDLKEWLIFLRLLNIEPLTAVPEHVDQFAGWLRRPVRPGQLRPVAAEDGPSRKASTANRILDSVYMFYEFHARRGVGMGAQLERYRPARPGDYGGFLAGIADRPVKERPTRLKEEKRRPATLSDIEVQQILDACDRLRDRFLMALMFETGCRIGQALGLHHEDIGTDRRAVTLWPRDNNVNRARGKSRDPKQIPVRRTLLDLYADYLFGEYGELDCDYVFVNLWNGPVGAPMGYWAVMSLVKRLRRRTGVDFHPIFSGTRTRPPCCGPGCAWRWSATFSPTSRSRPLRTPTRTWTPTTWPASWPASASGAPGDRQRALGRSAPTARRPASGHAVACPAARVPR